MKINRELILYWCILLALLGAGTSSLLGQTVRSITSAAPGAAPAGSPNLQVTLTYPFVGSSGTLSVTALWNGSPRPTNMSDFQLSMALSSADLVNPGLNEITIFDNQTGTMWPGGWKFPVYLPISANDLIYDSQRGLLYASVPSTGGIRGNNVIAVNPDTGNVTASVFVGSEPDRMALSDDFHWLYVFNDGNNSIVGIALDSFQAFPPFYTGGSSTSGLRTVSVVPGQPNSVLVGLNGTFKVFDNGTPRSKSANGNGVTAWTGPTTFVNTVPQLFSVTPTGVTAMSAAAGSTAQDVKAAGGRVYLSNGQVFDASTLALLGKFNGSGLVAVDPPVSRVYFLPAGPTNAYTISAFDTNTFVPMGSIGISSSDNSFGTVSRLVRFGPDGIAFPYRGQQNVSGGADKVFVFHSALFGAAPLISAASVVNAASGQGGGVSPGEVVTIYGTGLGPAAGRTLQLTASGTVDTAAGDTRVFFNSVAAPVVFTSSGQVNAVVPYAMARSTSAVVQVSYLGVLSNAVTLPVQSAMPALFTANGSGSGTAAAGNQDGSLNSTANPAPRGSVITLYATGEGQTTPAGSDGKPATAPLPMPNQKVSVSIGGVDSPVQYAGGAPGLVAGVMQVNVTVPQQISPGPAVPVVLSVGGITSSASVTVAIQ